MKIQVKRGVNRLTENKIPVHVPLDLYEEIKRRVESSQGEFKGVEEYVEFVLREVVREEETEQTYSPEEDEE